MVVFPDDVRTAVTFQGICLSCIFVVSLLKLLASIANNLMGVAAVDFPFKKQLLRLCRGRELQFHVQQLGIPVVPFRAEV